MPIVVVLPVPFTPDDQHDMRLQSCGRSRADARRVRGSRRSRPASASRTSSSVTSLPKRVRRKLAITRAATAGAQIGGDQRVFEFLQRLVVQLPLVEDAGNALGQLLRAAREPLLQLVEEATQSHQRTLAIRRAPPQAATSRQRRARAEPPRRQRSSSGGPARSARCGLRRRSRSAAQIVRPSCAVVETACGAGARLAQPAPRARGGRASARRACGRQACRVARCRGRRAGNGDRPPPPNRASRGTARRSRSESPRSGRRRSAIPGRSARARAATLSASARRWRRFMRLRIEIAARLEREMQMRHQARLLRERGAIARRRSPPDPARRGAGGVSPARVRAAGARVARGSAARAGPGRSSRCPRRSAPARGSRPDQRARLRDDRADRDAAARAAAVRDNAERAAMVAALLHLNERARTAGELGHADAPRSRAPP